MTIGKKIGLAAFLFLTLVITFGCFCIGYRMIINSIFESNVLQSILYVSLGVFTVVWGAKASSNFVSKDGEKKE